MAGVNMDSNERRLLLVFAYLLTWLSGVIVLFINDGRAVYDYGYVEVYFGMILAHSA